MAGILGFGGYVPERVMTNDDWAALVDTTDEWITTRTGIKRRDYTRLFAFALYTADTNVAFFCQVLSLPFSSLE